MSILTSKVSFQCLRLYQRKQFFSTYGQRLQELRKKLASEPEVADFVNSSETVEKVSVPLPTENASFWSDIQRVDAYEYV